MPPASPDSPFSTIARWLAWPSRLLLLLGACVVFVAVWVVLAWSRDAQCSWMALLGALDVAWILRLSGWPAGPRRAFVGVLGTATIVVAANWWIIAVHLGAALGFGPMESAWRLGINHAWLLAQLANGPLDLALFLASLVLAAFISR